MRAAAAEEGIEFAEAAPPTQDTLWLDENGFVTSLDNIFGHHKYTTHAHKLFQLLDGFSSGKVWWRQLINRLVAVGAKKTSTRAESWTPLSEQDIQRLEHCKRETLVKLVCVEREESFCYVAVSRGGRVGVYSGDMRLLHSYEMFYHRSGFHGRVKNRWITDAIYLPDVQFLMMSASDRSLTVYDAETLIHTPLYCITGLPNIPTCLAYTPSSPSCDTSELAFGTERGDVTLVRFLQPKVQLLHTKTPDAINYYFWMELPSPPHSSYCSITRWRRVHSRSVKRVAYSRAGLVLVTCSHDATASLRIRHVPGKMDDYTFKVIRGVTCFHIVSALHLVATGGCSGSVRLWQPCGRAPYATLTAPTSPPILDVAIIAAHELVLAYCNNCTVHIWDLYEECLLQTIKIKFPFLGVLGKKVEFGPYCIHPGPACKEDDEEELVIDEPLVLSRRGSSVYQGSTGGLMLQLDSQNDWDKKGLEDEPEYKRFNRWSVWVSCCDAVCRLRLAPPAGRALAPPAHELRARRPSAWDLHDEPTTSTSSTTPRLKPSLAPTPQLLSPSTAEFPLTDLDTLLENAGLQGILEKDFVLMQGLKNDLNRKLAEMEANKQVMNNAVSAGAPYLALKTFDPMKVEPVDEMMDEYKRVMRLFPDASITGTPTGSEMTTPRHSKTQRL
uniref:WD repeat-containing protein on Y chromosome n=1 Tax=Heliothis virescens TaxID=7102 RepID=A0A2A4JZX7_HELVI